MDAQDVDMKNWKIDFVWWRGQIFETIDQLKNAVGAGSVSIEKMVDPEDAHEPTLFSSLNFRGKPEPEEPRRGPQSFMPDGRRYKVNGHHVEWQGWEFNFGVRSATSKGDFISNSYCPKGMYMLCLLYYMINFLMFHFYKLLTYTLLH